MDNEASKELMAYIQAKKIILELTAYESVATSALRLTELSDFCERCSDVIYVLGPTFAPEQKSVIHLFTRALPHDLYDLVNGAQINSHTYRTIATYPRCN